MLKVSNIYTFTGKPYEMANGVNIYQKKIEDVLGNKMYSIFLMPFLLTLDYYLEKDATSRYTFDSLFKLDEEGEFLFKENNTPLLTFVLLGLQFFFETKEVNIDHNGSIVIDGKFVITRNNFDEICDIIAELNGRERKRKLVPPENLNDEQRAIWIKTMKGRKRKAEKEGMDILDIVNVVVHFGNECNYEKVMNLTILQLYNTFGVFMSKDQYEKYYQMYSSGQFQIKEHQENWISKIQLKNNTKED